MLKVHTQKLGDVTILCLRGRIAIGDTTPLRNAVLSQADASAVVLDLARVNGIDARGLGVLLELREWTQTKGIEFRLRNVTRLLQQVLKITRLDSVFDTSQPTAQSAAVGLPIEAEAETAVCV
ncbi:MAG: STAS domain-containing protein [Pyrinomonadaceae bacterium]